MEDVIREELNVKTIHFLAEPEKIAKVSVSPNARLIVPRFSKKVQDIIVAAKEGNFKELGDGRLEICNEVLENTEYEWRYEATGNLKAQGVGEVLVGLNTEITEVLKQEGIIRDIIREIQEARKDAGFDISDRIALGIDLRKFDFDPSLIKLLQTETLTKEISDKLKTADFEKEIEIDSDKLSIQLKKL